MSDQGFVRQRPRQAGRRSPCGDAEIQELSHLLARLRVATEPNVESARLSLSRSNEDSLLCACRKTASRSSANCSRVLSRSTNKNSGVSFLGKRGFTRKSNCRLPSLNTPCRLWL